MGCVYEGWSAWEDNVLYRLLVPLQPLPEHAFHWELDTAEEILTNDTCLHLQLQCICMREQLVEDILCFLHHHKDELKSQDSSLLNTLCTSSLLNIKKTACWFLVPEVPAGTTGSSNCLLVKDTWKVMPQSHHCQLTMLPTTCSWQAQANEHLPGNPVH